MKGLLQILAIALLLAAAAAAALCVGNGDGPPEIATTPVPGTTSVPVTPPHHHIPPEYFANATPATPLTESEMLTIVLSQATFDTGCRNEGGILFIPLTLLDMDIATGTAGTRLVPSEQRQNWYLDAAIDASEPVVMIRMPITMYENFCSTPQDGCISFPAVSFCNFYESMADLESHIVVEGDVVSVVG